MQIQDLYNELVAAYRTENLNALTSDIITLYRGNDLARLRQVHAMIYPGNQADEDPISRIFSKIIMHYHPDRNEQIFKELSNLLNANDLVGLKTFEHILDVQNMDLSYIHSGSSADIDFNYEDIWDDTVSGYSYIDDEEKENEEYDPYVNMIFDHGFITAVKRKIYGHLNVEFPVHLLADMEIIEMAEYEIEDLDGIEFCTYARIIDLSGNNLAEVTQLSQLMRLEEVYLQNNHISYVDGLNELPFLSVIDLSYNDIDDITPLFEVETLEFLNVIGNRIPNWQLETLSLAGVVVVA